MYSKPINIVGVMVLENAAIFKIVRVKTKSLLEKGVRFLDLEKKYRRRWAVAKTRAITIGTRTQLKMYNFTFIVQIQSERRRDGETERRGDGEREMERRRQRDRENSGTRWSAYHHHVMPDPREHIRPNTFLKYHAIQYCIVFGPISQW